MQSKANRAHAVPSTRTHLRDIVAFVRIDKATGTPLALITGEGLGHLTQQGDALTPRGSHRHVGEDGLDHHADSLRRHVATQAIPQSWAARRVARAASSVHRSA